MSDLLPDLGGDVSALMAPPDRSFVGRAADALIPLGLRVVGGVGGAIAGGAAGLAAGGVGALPGAIGGGAAGSALGEGLAEGYEVMRGLREEINPTQIAVQGALGAIPAVGKAPTVARAVLSRAGQGAALSATSDVATRLAEGEIPTVGSVATAAGLGVALGGPLGALEGRSATRAARGLTSSVKPPTTGAPRLGDDVSDLIRGTAPAARRTPAIGEDVSDLLGARPTSATAYAAKPTIRRIESDVDVPPVQRIPDRDLVSEKMASRIPDPEQRADVLRVIEENGGFATQRGGVVSDERVQALAQQLRVDSARVLPAGTVLNAAETQAYANAVATVMDRIKTLSAKLATPHATDVDRLVLATAREEQVILIQSALGARAEAGRALRNYAVLGQVLRGGDDLAIKQAMKHPAITGMNDFAQKFAALPDDVSQMNFIRDHQKMTPFETVQSFWINNVLSGVKTHLRNLIGTNANAAFRSVSHVAATGYDLARSVTTGAPRTMYIGEYSPQAAGALLGIRDGLDEAAFVLKNGYAREKLLTFDTPRPELKGVLRPFNMPGRALEAEDQALFAIYKSAEVWKRAYAKARSEVGKDHDLITLKLSDWKLRGFPKDIVAEAEKEALAILYRDDPGKFAQRIIDLKSEGGSIGKALTFVIPFVRVPASVIRQSIENMPGGAFATTQGRAAMRAGGRPQAEMVGRMVTGTVALGTLAYWASQGKISGEGPSDPNERTALMESGWRPRSVKIGDSWVSYEMPFQAIAAPLTAVGNAWEAYHSKGGMPDVVSMLSGLIRTPMDMSFLSGLSDFTLAVSDPKRYAARFAGNVASGFVPFAGLQRNLTNTIDPVIRDPRTGGITSTAASQVQSIVPGLSTRLPARLDSAGQPVVRDPGAGFSPISISPAKTDVIVRELKRLGVNLGVPTRKLEPTKVSPEINLTNSERALIGSEVRQALEALIGDGTRIRQVDDELARRAIGRVVAGARARAAARIRSRHSNAPRQ